MQINCLPYYETFCFTLEIGSYGFIPLALLNGTIVTGSNNWNNWFLYMVQMVEIDGNHWLPFLQLLNTINLSPP